MNADLRKELLERMKDDQEMRFKMTMDQSVDLRNTFWLKKIVDEYGWPDIKMVGKRGSVAAWILAQHADHDPDFQKKCLGLMAESYERGYIVPEYFALLTDRVLVNHGKHQLYGTQFNSLKNGELRPYPIKDMAGLNERRRAMGMISFEDYQRDHLAFNRKLQKKLKKRMVRKKME